MDSQEKKRKAERKKKLNRKKREFIREQKESLRRQKNELREKKKKHRRRKGLFRKLRKYFDEKRRQRLIARKLKNENRYLRKKVRQAKIQRFKKQTLGLFFKSYRKQRALSKDELIHKEIQQGIRKQKFDETKKRFIGFFRKLFGRKKILSKDELIQKEIQRGIRKQQLNEFKEQVIEFFLNPLGRKKRSRKEELIHKEIQQGIRKQQLDELKKYPDKLSNSIEKIRFTQKMRLQYFRDKLQRALSGFAIIKENRILRLELLKSYLNSLATFLFAFVFLYLGFNLVSIIAAKFFNIPAILYSYRIFWPLYTYSALYSRQALIIIFGAGPLASIIMAILFFQVLKRIRHFQLNLKILLLWMIFHSVNLFFGAYISGMITRTGFIYATEWLFFSNIFDVEEIIFLIISIITMITVGFYFTRYFILSANNNLVILPKIRIFYFISKVLLPWLTGVVLLYFLNFPNNPPELVLLLAVSFLMIIPVFFNYNSFRNINIELVDKEGKEFVGWIYILASVLLLGFYKIVLFNGFSFG